MNAERFIVDPTDQFDLTAAIYGLNHDYRTGGVGYIANSSAWVLEGDGNYNYSSDMVGLSLSYDVAVRMPEGQYWTASEKSAFLNRMFNDVDDPTASACTTTNQDAGMASQSNHNWVLSSGLVAAGTNDATHVQLPNTDPHYSTTNYYNNTVVMLTAANGGTSDYIGASYGLVTAQNNTGLLTVSSWSNGYATRSQIVSATYTSGLTSIVGTTGQYVCLDFGGNSYGLLPLTGTNTIAGGTTINVTGPYTFVSAPTSASVNGNCSTASASGTATVSTSLGTQYTIFDTITTSSTTAAGTATITFTKTASLAGSINVGDGIMAYNGWGNNFTPSYYMSYVTAVGTNTLTVINGPQVTASTTTAQMAWRFPQWTTGDVGRLWVTKQQAGDAFGVQPVVYSAGAGTVLSNNAGQYVLPDATLNGGGATPPAWGMFELVTAPDDTRAVRDLPRQSSWVFDLGLAPLIDYAGRYRDGPNYSFDQDMPSAELFVWGMKNSLTGFPDLTSSVPWTQNSALLQMFTTLPQLYSNNAYTAGWAGSNGTGYGGSQICGFGVCLPMQGHIINPVFRLAPTGNVASWFRDWQATVNTNSPNRSMFNAGNGYEMAEALLHNDPRIPDVSYTNQPLQYVLNQTGGSQVASLTGRPHLYSGNIAMSRTCWQCASGTVTMFDEATFSSTDTYDAPRLGNISIWKGGGVLIGSDTNIANFFAGSDPSITADAIGFGQSYGNTFLNGVQGSIGETTITQWASANAGTYGVQYGDASSRYAAACGNNAPGYNASALGFTISYMVRCWVHLKHSSDDEWVFQFDDVSLSGGTSPIYWHLQYPEQVGGTQQGFGNYTTGSTTYLGSNVIESVEDGNSGRNYGLLTYVYSPGTITLYNDCAGLASGNCSPSHPPTGGQGYTTRFSINGGGSVGASVSSLTTVVGHKLMGSLTDTTFTTANINPDSNWTGVQLTGALSTGIGLFARGGTTHSSMTNWTMTASGTVDMLVAGLSPGAYSLVVGGAQVYSGNVASGDSTLYSNFTAASGCSSGCTVVLSGGITIGLPTILTGGTIFGGQIHYFF